MDYRRFANQVVVGAAVAVLASASHAITIYVDDDNCPGPGDGSELNPYCSIQTAIDNAVDTDEIIVAPGTYFEEYISFFGKAITLRSSDGPEVTILDGQSAHCVVFCENGEGPDTVLEGFTITNGYYPAGGGMQIYVASPTVTNCIFSGNEAWNLDGGGMHITLGSPTVTDCTFSGNTASHWGGGMFNNSSSPTVTGCTFSDDQAGYGGGMHNRNSSPTVINCTFSGNSAVAAGGGMRNWEGSNPTVTDCTFCGNDPDDIHGPVVLDGTRMSPVCPPPVCPGDITGDGEVGVTDFLALLANWGACP